MKRPAARAAPTSSPSGPARVWEARTGTIAADFLAYSQSIEDDAPFVASDLAGSVAHVAGLHHAGLLTSPEARQLVEGLQSLHRQWEAGSFRLDATLEDGHMNIEANLTASLGDVGRRLHTGRSRNDQVATCITLYARLGLARIAQGALGLATALVEQASTHAATPWVARTHGQPAQAATLGFLLAAHAFRFQDLAEAALRSFEAIGESPLGSGAVAGSTLPLDPAYTARLLALRPPRNALLATGTRDSILDATTIAARAGLLCASLAQDLLELYAQKALKLPDGYTTGSSLMPQKRNPDALELARGTGASLAGPLAAVTATMSGRTLGYWRDFQTTKPHLVHAIEKGGATLELLAAAVEGATFQAAAFSAAAQDASLAATDVAEALVKAGLPFRTAYTIAAKAYAGVETGTTVEASLAKADLNRDQLAAATAVLRPDASRRTTIGGPAPSRVKEQVAALASSGRQLAAEVAGAQRAAGVPFGLLSIRPSSLIPERP